MEMATPPPPPRSHVEVRVSKAEGMLSEKLLSLISKLPLVAPHVIQHLQSQDGGGEEAAAAATGAECQRPHYWSKHIVTGNCFFQVLFAQPITINRGRDLLFAQM